MSKKQWQYDLARSKDCCQDQALNLEKVFSSIIIDRKISFSNFDSIALRNFEQKFYETRLNSNKFCFLKKRLF